MLKKTALLIVLVCSFGLIAEADFSLEKWQYEKKLNGVKEGINELVLDNDVFANSAKGLADVRVVDGANKEVPYKLLAVRKEEGRKDYRPAMINNSVVSGKYSTVVMDLGERGLITNSLTVQTKAENFQRNVTVYGSDDQISWNVLKLNGYIYDYTDKKANFKSQNTTVSFPDSVFKFLKIEISDVDGNPIDIEAATVNQFLQKKAQEFSLLPSFEISQDSESNTTSLTADLRQGGIPTSKIALSIKDGNFNRRVAIYSNNDKNSNEWKAVGQGYVFRYNTPKFVGENTSIEMGETTDRYFKIVVYNNDNAALDIFQLTTFAAYRELVFQAGGDGGYALFYGNIKAKAPEYDLEKYFQYLDLAKAQKVTLGAQEINEGFMAEKQPEKPFTEKYPYFLTFALATSGLILLLMVYKFLKK